ncbi:MAG: hypothetical protein LBI53_06090 [Candidatus Peribacteria bacterium]|jgi:hypothetical protein|nr:hypothetical protein [Candidatus Peribacteria bacterium]
MRIEKNKDISTPIRSSRLRTYIPIIATALILSLNSCENKASEQIDNSKSFFSGLALSDFNEGSGLKYQKKRERRYQGKDPDWNPFNRK